MVLGVVVAAVGPAISHLSLTPLRLIVGGLLLIFGMQWIRKAMLRSSGYKAMHDEDVIYDSTRVSAIADTSRSILRRLLVHHCLQGCASSRASKSSSSFSHSGPHNIGSAISALVASLTVVAVAAAGVLIHRPLSRVPENTLKFIVGILLTSFGMFWSAEGAGVAWPGGESAIPVLIALIAGTSVLLARALRRQHRRILAPQVPS